MRQFKTFFSYSLLGFFTLLLFAQISDIGWRVLVHFLNKNFQIEKITITGTNNEIITNTAKQYYGENIVLFKTNQLKNTLEQIGFVENAMVYKNMPEEIVIKIIERTPFAILNNSFTIDKNGIIISEDVLEGDLLHINSEMFDHDIINCIPNDLISNIEHINNRRWNIKLKTGAVIKLPNDKDRCHTLMENAMKFAQEGNVVYVDARIKDKLFIKYKKK